MPPVSQAHAALVISFVPVTRSPSVFQGPNSYPSKTFHRH